MIVEADALRSRFAERLSALYREEVPCYATLLGLVARVNAEAGDTVDSRRIAVERHGAIRVGRADEFRDLARLFGVLGMEPVGYYDLAPSGIPVHATAFRPVSESALARNPLRIFASLLRLDLVSDADLRRHAETILARRRLFGPDLLAAIGRAEADGGVAADAVDAFLAEAVTLFRWRREAVVDAATYARLLAAHPLVADVVSFRGPHINHLTPRTVDIDAVHAGMAQAGMVPKETIEGPPRRRVPILLRQTSFKALREDILFPSADGAPPVPGAHTARFGEVESRGAALTPEGRALYDRLLADRALDMFPDDWQALRDRNLVFARRVVTASGAVREEPITYEDFLPVSAAGIFRSNLAGDVSATTADGGRREALEAAVERPLLDEFALYAALAAAPPRVASD